VPMHVVWLIDRSIEQWWLPRVISGLHSLCLATYYSGPVITWDIFFTFSVRKNNIFFTIN
jgi:hypothetical protein